MLEVASWYSSSFASLVLDSVRLGTHTAAISLDLVTFQLYMSLIASLRADFIILALFCQTVAASVQELNNLTANNANYVLDHLFNA